MYESKIGSNLPKKRIIDILGKAAGEHRGMCMDELLEGLRPDFPALAISELDQILTEMCMDNTIRRERIEGSELYFLNESMFVDDR